MASTDQASDYAQKYIMKLKADINFVNSDGFTFYYDGTNASEDEAEFNFTIKDTCNSLVYDSFHYKVSINQGENEYSFYNNVTSS